MAILIPLAICLAISYVVVTAIHNIFLHPLAKYPGPFLCRISGLPSFYHACIGDRHIWCWQQFQIYGSKFRAAPNLLLFNTPEANNSLFAHRSNVCKSNFYVAWQRDKDDVQTLNCTGVAEHASKRKLLSLAFTDQSIKASGAFMAKHIDRWNEILIGDKPEGIEEWSKPRNMSTWVDYLTFDILGDLCFGRSFETKEGGENELREIPHAIADFMKFIYPIAKSPLLDSLIWLKPRGLDSLLAASTPPNIKHYYEFTADAVKQRLAKERYLEAEKLTVERQDMFHFLCSARDPDTGQHAFDETKLRAEAHLLIIAGSDTSGTTLAGLFFYLIHYPRVLAKLVREIRATFTDADEIVQGPKLNSCVYLRACIEEALRIAPALPDELERKVLPGGATIDGDFFPEGVVLGIPGWSLNHNADVFGDAKTFRPERWIPSSDPDMLNSEEEVARLRHSYAPFGKGVGSCLGQKLAWLQISMAVARTLWKMDVRAAPGEDVGAGKDALGWGRRERNVWQVRDAFLSLRDGPVVQLRWRRDVS